jgi:mgtE-like transporter
VPLVIFAGILSFYVPYIETITVLIIVIAIIENVTAFWRKFSYRKIVSQSFLILAMSGIMSSIAGILIQAKLDYFILLPSLLVLFPAFINQGGSIGNVFAARLATRFHLGSLELKFDENMKREIVTSYGVSLLVYPFLALLTYFASHLVGLNITISLVNIIFVTLIAGFLVTTVVIFISFFMARLSYKFNLDPDNVISPVITGTTDIIGVFTLFYIFVLSGIV